MNLTNLQEAKEEKIRLIWMLNSIQEKIDAYWLEDVASSSEYFKEICAKKQQIEQQIKEINKLLSI